MAKDHKLLQFLESKGATVENLRAIQLNLDRCVDQGMVDSNSVYYNELVDLIDEARLSENWDELLEVITKAKTLEVDVAVWLAQHGQTSISLPWPSPKGEQG